MLWLRHRKNRSEPTDFACKMVRVSTSLWLQGLILSVGIEEGHDTTPSSIVQITYLPSDGLIVLSNRLYSLNSSLLFSEFCMNFFQFRGIGVVGTI